jgi:hypothetical protein
MRFQQLSIWKPDLNFRALFYGDWQYDLVHLRVTQYKDEFGDIMSEPGAGPQASFMGAKTTDDNVTAGVAGHCWDLEEMGARLQQATGDGRSPTTSHWRRMVHGHDRRREAMTPGS